ncbi:hypothetical protein [Micromonospora sp. NBC_01813]|uniref:hypothetical protein n=1 Tax=Micromonospora sp. NBC_01813 TaxID=2975988 RepID=UPI002DD980AB|nr:hypothetical protein [Micromonospora sp. NBC_01813]WSA06940.1 hypothetical protein OG958_22090 [Micromonospora sp. NBC_01813]
MEVAQLHLPDGFRGQPAGQFGETHHVDEENGDGTSLGPHGRFGPSGWRYK